MEQHLLIASYMEQCFPRYISSIGIREGFEIDITVKSFNLFNLVQSLNYDLFLAYEVLVDLWIVDYPNEINRFQVNYILGSIITTTRLHIILIHRLYLSLFASKLFKAVIG